MGLSTALGLGAAAIGAFGANRSAKAQERAAEAAAQAAQFRPFNTTGAFGSTNITPGSQGQPGSIGIGTNPQIELFQALTGRLGQQFQQAPGIVFGPGAAPDVGLQGLFDNLTQAAGQDPLAGFDAQSFAQNQFDRLQSLASRGEETAAARTANQLFARGRLGGADTAAGGVFGRLAEAQEQARTQRALQSFGLARAEQDRLQANRAGDINAALSGFGAGGQLFSLLRGDQFQTAGFTNQARQQLFSNLQGAVGGINQASAPLFQQLQAALQAGGAATSAAGTGAALQLQGAQNAGAIRGEFFGNLLGGVGDLFGGGGGAASPAVQPGGTLLQGQNSAANFIDPNAIDFNLG